MMADKSHWMEQAFSHNKGAFKAKAKKAGMGTDTYAKKVTAKGSKADTKTKRQANLARIGAKYGHAKRTALD